MTVRRERPDERKLPDTDAPFQHALDLTTGMPLDPDDDPLSYPGAQPDRALGTKPEDFPSFYVRHRTTMTHVAGRYLSDRRDADEVVQEAFLKMFLALPELPTELAALAYARRTVVNLCIDRLRATGRRPRLIDLDAVPESTLGLVEPDDPVIAAEDAVIVREALARLTPLHREALVMREVEELPLPEIAHRLSIPEETVKHVLHRARRALRRILAGSAVDPSVDIETLTIAQLVAKKPVRVAVIILLLVGGVLTSRPLLGLGPNHGTSTADTHALGRPGVIPPLPGVVGPAPTVPTEGAPKQPKRQAKPTLAQSPPAQASPPATGLLLQAPATASTPSTAVATSPTLTKVVTPAAPTPIKAKPVAPPHRQDLARPAVVQVTGLGGVTAARVSNETRAASVGGYRSSSTLTARTSSGEFALNQALSLVDTPHGLDVESATANPVLPTPGGGVGYLLETFNVDAAKTARGVQVSFSGVATPLVADNPDPADAVVLIVTTLYDRSLTQVLKETVNLGVPSVSPGHGDLGTPPVPQAPVSLETPPMDVPRAYPHT